MRVALLIIIPNHLLVKILLISVGLEVLLPKGRRLLSGNTGGSTGTERGVLHMAILCSVKPLNILY